MNANVNKGMNGWIAAAMMTLAAGSLRAQEPPVAAQQAEAVTMVVVPVVGNVVGVNEVNWKTDVELRNEQTAEMTVSLSLPCATGEPFMILTLAPGQTQRFVDVISEAFGMPTALSPLVVRTLGRRSVSIRATAYGTRGVETFPPQPIAINYGPSYFRRRALQDLSFTDRYRTNIGIANLGESDTDVTIALQRIPGRNLAVTRLTLPSNALLHTSIQSIFPLITKGDHFAVVVESSSPDTYAYASVIENATNKAVYIPSTVAPAR